MFLAANYPCSCHRYTRPVPCESVKFYTSHYGTIALQYNFIITLRRNRNGYITNMANMNLDAIDLKLLAELQADGRITNVDLATKVGLTAPPCLRRMRALEQSGTIKSYHADIDAGSLGYTITVFAMVSLKSQAEDDLKAFEQHVRALPDVRECHMLNGEIDFILKIVARDLQSFQEFLTSQLTSAPNVSSVKTSLTIRTAKDEPGVPIPAA
jgi:DNA-binding Lrp family transcriptional regulator